jgi:hypothetical protein
VLQALCGRMTERFYDEKEFFSSQLLFGRFDNPQPIKESLFPAMCEYIEHYVKMVKDLEPNEDPAFMARVEELHVRGPPACPGPSLCVSAADPRWVCLFHASWAAAWPERAQSELDTVLILQGKYDQYSAEKDPAAALFAANWGNEWAESFVYDFLFDKATVRCRQAHRLR